MHRARQPRRSLPRWVPNQHGAWAMLIVPFVLGSVLRARAGESLVALVPLFGCWMAGYVAFYATSGWLKAPHGRRPAWLPSLIAAAGASAAFGVLALALVGSGLLAWVPAFLPLLVPALVLASRRRERAVLGGALTVAAASLMTLVARHPDAGQLLAHPDAAAAGAAVGAFAYFFGTVLYVKTLIRERGNRAYLVASVGWHAVATLVAAAGASTGVARPWWALFFAATTVRAWVGPHLRSLPTPKQAGFGEIALCVALVGAFALT